MTPLQEAVLHKILEVKNSIDRRTKAKTISEEIEEFNYKVLLKDDQRYKDLSEVVKNKEDLTGAKLSMPTGVSLQIGQFKEVEGGFEAEVLLLEDGLIPNRILFGKGANKKAVDTFKKDKKKLLVNDSHIPIEWSLLQGNLGAITSMRVEKFGEKKDKTRTYATIFLDGNNPVVQWLVSFGNDMNEILKKEGYDFNIFSVSAEVEFEDFDYIEFAGSFVASSEDFKFTGMGIVFNPANLSSFGTVESLSDNDKNSDLFKFLQEEIMSKKDKDLQNKEEELKAKKKLEEQEEQEESPEGEEVPAEENKPESEQPESEAPEGEDEGEEAPEGEEKPEEGEEEDKPEGEEEEKPEEKEGEDEEEEGEDEEDGEEEPEGDHSASVKELRKELKEVSDIAKESLSLVKEQKETNEKLSKEVESLRSALDASGKGDVLSRTPSKGETEKLSLAQKTSKEGNKSKV